MEHIRGTRHIENERLKDRKSTDRSPDRSPVERSRDDRSPAPLYINGRRIFDDEREPDVVPRFMRASSAEEKTIWIIGTGEMKDLIDATTKTGMLRRAFRMEEYSFVWHCARGLLLKEVVSAAENLLTKGPVPSHIFLHIGGNDLGTMKEADLLHMAKDVVRSIQNLVPEAKLIWDQLLPRCTGFKDSFTLNRNRREVDDEIASFILNSGGSYLRFPGIELRDRFMYEESLDGDLSFSAKGLDTMRTFFTGGMRSIVLRDMRIVPDMKDLHDLCSAYVRAHILPALNKSRGNRGRGRGGRGRGRF